MGVGDAVEVARCRGGALVVHDGERAVGCLMEMFTEQVVGKDYAYADGFGFGFDLIVGGLERQLGSA